MSPTGCENGERCAYLVLVALMQTSSDNDDKTRIFRDLLTRSDLSGPGGMTSLCESTPR